MTRLYPPHPLVAVGAVIFDAQGRVALVKRGAEPLAGQWTLPGGLLEIGETLDAGVAREVLEETGVVVRVGPLVALVDRIVRDDEGRAKYHYVIADYLCEIASGDVCAGSDAEAVTFAEPGALAGEFGVALSVVDVVTRASERRRPSAP